MSILDRIALALVVIGGINWGLVGIFRFDLVAWIFGGQAAILSRVIFTLHHSHFPRPGRGQGVVISPKGAWQNDLLNAARDLEKFTISLGPCSIRQLQRKGAVAFRNSPFVPYFHTVRSN